MKKKNWNAIVREKRGTVEEGTKALILFLYSVVFYDAISLCTITSLFIVFMKVILLLT